MDIPWLIGIFLGIDLLCGTSFAHISVLPIPKDYKGHGTQYRFQYYVRDESGDYKTQEEAGEGGKSRGSYAVEESNGDLRIVQYTAELGGDFEAHIEVDRAGKAPSKLQKIDIPAEEMRKLIESNRNKTARGEFLGTDDLDSSSKINALGPPKKMSEIVMEQAAAIREIISKEIEAEEKREAEEKKLGKLNSGKKSAEEKSEDVVDCGEENTGIENEKIEEKKEAEILSERRTPKSRKVEASVVDSFRNSQISVKEEPQSPVVRVALTPRKIEDLEKPVKKSTQIPGAAEGGPVQNFSFKNRIVFYKPLEKKGGRNEPEVETAKQRDGEDIGEQIPEEEEIVLYSPYREGGKEGDRDSRFITVPYEVLRPYLAQIKGNEEKKNE